MFGTENGVIDPRAGRLEVSLMSKQFSPAESNRTILELEDCKSDIYDDYNMAF